MTSAVRNINAPLPGQNLDQVRAVSPNKQLNQSEHQNKQKEETNPQMNNL